MHDFGPLAVHPHEKSPTEGVVFCERCDRKFGVNARGWQMYGDYQLLCDDCAQEKEEELYHKLMDYVNQIRSLRKDFPKKRHKLAELLEEMIEFVDNYFYFVE